MTSVLRRFPVLLLALGIALVARADGAVLHEYVADLSEADLAVVVTGQADEPLGVVYDGELLGPPPGGGLHEGEQMLLGAAAPPPGPRSEPPVFRPDRLTSTHTSTGYFEVFTPGVAPFKRVTAYDRINVDPDGTPVLTVHATTPRVVRVVGANAPDPDGRPRDRFWGSVVIDFRQGERAELPSVSAESRILHVRTEPSIPVRIETDSAQNFYVVALAPASRPVRITFLTDAPRGYFNQEVPDVRVGVAANEVPPVPESVKQRALGFARTLGIGPGDSLRHALEVLVTHFRSFREAETPPRASDDIYLDLARGGLGVCRHRAYAFVITAQSLGIPARYLQNEAHAWVEVKLGRAGFLRVDLGGSTRGVEGHGLEDRPLYRPSAPDPFPQPESFRRAQAEAASQPSSPFVTGPGEGEAGRERPSPTSPGATPRGASEAAAAPEPGATAPSPTRPGRPLAITVDGRSFRALRGRALDVHGRIVDAGGQGVAGLRVEILLAGPPERRLGVTVTAADGAFDASVGIPPDLSVGHYGLVLRTPGDGTHAAAEAR